MKQELEPDVNRTHNLRIWSKIHYHCTTDPLSICHSNSNSTWLVNYTQAQYTTQLSDLECATIVARIPCQYVTLVPATRPVNYAHAQYTIIEVKDVMLEKERATF